MANLKMRASAVICYHYWRLTTRVVKPLWLASTVIIVFITKQILRNAWVLNILKSISFLLTRKPAVLASQTVEDIGGWPMVCIGNSESH